MSPRRVRQVQQRAWWVGTAHLLHLFSGVLLAALFVFEKDAVVAVHDGASMPVVRESDAHDGGSVGQRTFRDLNRSVEARPPDDAWMVQGAAVDGSQGARKFVEEEDDDHLLVNAQRNRSQNVAIVSSDTSRATEQTSHNLTLMQPNVHPPTPRQPPQPQQPPSKTIASRQGNPFRGVLQTDDTAQLFQTENVTFLSFMVYRLIKTYNMTSLIDIPCTSSISWMPSLLQRLEYEIPRFHYRCIVPDDDHLVDAVLHFKNLTSAVVVKDPMYWTSVLPKADLAFAWYGVGFLPPHISWQLVKSIRQSQTKFLIVANNPTIYRNPIAPTKHGRVNLRRSPYLFADPFRVMKNMSTDPQVQKDMLFYKLDGVRPGVI